MEAVKAETQGYSSFLYYPWNCHWFKEKPKTFQNVFSPWFWQCNTVAEALSLLNVWKTLQILHIIRAATSLCVWSSNQVWFVQFSMARINMTHLRKRETNLAANKTEDCWSNKNICKCYFSCLWLSMTQIKAERFVRSRQCELLKRYLVWVGRYN